MKLKLFSFSVLLVLANSICYAQNSNNKKNAPEYGKSVWAIAPISFSEVSKGIGLSYERALDEKGIIALWIPVMFGFRSYENNILYNAYDNNAVYGHFYAMPGIKIYPSGNDGACKYSLGPNFVFATGDKATPNDYISPTGNPVSPTESFLKLGFMLNNSLNINPTQHLYLGLDFGFGITYLYQVSGINNGTTGLVHFAFRIGYRS
jgi:hypothetical protein